MTNSIIEKNLIILGSVTYVRTEISKHLLLLGIEGIRNKFYKIGNYFKII